jgi:hypothetical protein
MSVRHKFTKKSREFQLQPQCTLQLACEYRMLFVLLDHNVPLCRLQHALGGVCAHMTFKQ